MDPDTMNRLPWDNNSWEVAAEIAVRSRYNAAAFMEQDCSDPRVSSSPSASNVEKVPPKPQDVPHPGNPGLSARLCAPCAVQAPAERNRMPPPRSYKACQRFRSDHAVFRLSPQPREAAWLNCLCCSMASFICCVDKKRAGPAGDLYLASALTMPEIVIGSPTLRSLILVTSQQCGLLLVRPSGLR
jgi:hypothetical protein